jgi:hypothetical protein
VGASGQIVTITLDPQLSPPNFVRFTSVSIRPSLAQPNSQAPGSQVATVEATTFTRAGNTIRAEFNIPASFPRGAHSLALTFPGRDSEPITFSYPVEIE